MVGLLLNSSIPMDTLKCFQTINDNIDAVKHIVVVSNDTIANEISAINTMLVAFTVIFGVIGVFIGTYISWLQRKVSKMSDNIEKKEQTIVKLAQIVEDTDNKIQSDISGLYAKLRKEETKALLCRLEEEPLDIGNLSYLLLARQLEDEGFPILKRAFMKLLDNEPETNAGGLFFLSEREQYSLLFFQHYLYNSILDIDIRPEIEKNYSRCMQCAFKRDIINSTNEFCRALSIITPKKDKVLFLATYLKALNESKFKNLIELKSIFQEKTDSNLLVDAIEKCTTEKVYLELFGIEAPKSLSKTEDNIPENN